MMRCHGAAVLVILSVFRLVQAEKVTSRLSLSENARSVLAYGETAYEAAPSTDYSGYSAASEAAIPKVVTELRLGCSCALHIPCYNLQTSECVPTICGSNSQASFVDNHIPRYSHPTNDDDAASGDTSASSDGYRSLYDSSEDNVGMGASYSNPVIDGCKCPSGTTRCYGCAEVGPNTRGFMWVLVVIFLICSCLVISLVRSDSMPPTPWNQHALAVVGSMFFVFGLAALSYLCIALDTGYIVRSFDLRRIYFSRYFDWLVNTQVMLYAVTYVGGAAPVMTFALLSFDFVMIVMGFLGALVSSRAKWAFFLIGFLAYVSIAVLLLVKINPAEAQRKVVYSVLKWVLVLLFLLYPIVWVLAEGVGVMCASTEAVLYGIVDLLIKVAFCLVVTFARPLLTRGLNRSESEPSRD